MSNRAMQRAFHRAFHTEAIILRRMDFGEADRLLTILTPEHGKLKAIAKGSRKPLGRQTGHVELFTRAKMTINRGAELHVVSQAEMVEPYLPLREDLERGAYATYIVELLDRFSELEETNISLYHLLDASLAHLSAPAPVDLALAVRFFELHLLELVGFQPAFFHCAIGQEDLEPVDQYFSPLEGGVVCPDHVRGQSLIPLSLTALKTFRYLQSRDYDVIKRLRVQPPLHAELERVLQSYIVFLLEMRLKSVDFIRQIRHPGTLGSTNSAQ